ncbi:MAG TPA: hypothetical protein P5044_07250 [bacterium]|nr:hypothetical protein [bacterium]
MFLSGEEQPAGSDEKPSPVKEESVPEDSGSKENKDNKEMDSEQDYNLKLRNLEEKINSLKDKIFRSKQRLSILQETVLSGSIAGARLTITHKNQVGKAFKLVSAIYYLDEAPVYKKLEESTELDSGEIVVFDGSVVPGPHHISVFLVYQGRGFGFFSYMKGYSFKMKTGHSVNVEEGNLMEVTVSPQDKGSSANIDNRLYISFDVSRKMFEDKIRSEQGTENPEQ